MKLWGQIDVKAILTTVGVSFVMGAGGFMWGEGRSAARFELELADHGRQIQAVRSDLSGLDFEALRKVPAKMERIANTTDAIKEAVARIEKHQKGKRREN